LDFEVKIMETPIELKLVMGAVFIVAGFPVIGFAALHEIGWIMLPLAGLGGFVIGKLEIKRNAEHSDSE
jgi:hypothetical protein